MGGGLAQLLGGIRSDDLNKLAVELQRLVEGEITHEFARMIAALANVEEISVEELAPISEAVDRWTVLVGKFATAKDAQLDLTEAVAGLLV